MPAEKQLIHKGVSDFDLAQQLAVRSA